MMQPTNNLDGRLAEDQETPSPLMGEGWGEGEKEITPNRCIPLLLISSPQGRRNSPSYETINHRAWWFVVLLLLVSACGGKALEISYYSLTPLGGLEQRPAAVATLPDLSLGIGPVTVPEALRRSQILTRAGDNQFTYSESHRWAGEVESDISRIIGENVSVLLGTERVAVFPWTNFASPDYRIILNIQEFHGVPGEYAVLNVRWAIRHGEDKSPLVVKKSLIREPTDGDGYAALVRAQSAALVVLSREISEEIARLAASQGADEQES